MNLTDDPRTQSALPLVPPAVRSLLAPWGYPPCRMSLYILRTIANIGNVAAQFTLGWMYEHGDDDNDVAQDYAEAATWCHRAAAQGDVRAQNNLARMHEDGHGVPKDDAAAARSMTLIPPAASAPLLTFGRWNPSR